VLKPFDLEEMYLFPKDLQVIDLAGARQEEGHMTPGGKAATSRPPTASSSTWT